MLQSWASVATKRRLLFPPLAPAYEALLIATVRRFALLVIPESRGGVRNGRQRMVVAAKGDVDDAPHGMLPLFSYADGPFMGL